MRSKLSTKILTKQSILYEFLAEFLDVLKRTLAQNSRGIIIRRHDVSWKTSQQSLSSQVTYHGSNADVIIELPWPSTDPPRPVQARYTLRISKWTWNIQKVPFAHIPRASSRLSLCACAVTRSIQWQATDAISWNSCYVYIFSCALNTFKTIELPADCEIRPVIRFFVR
jgi:hypothetical protein